jgi:hypothetical protein
MNQPSTPVLLSRNCSPVSIPQQKTVKLGKTTEVKASS